MLTKGQYVVAESEASLQSTESTLQCYCESINEAPLWKKNTAVRIWCVGWTQKEKKKPQQSPELINLKGIPKEKDLLCGAAIKCFARSWSVKYTKGVQSTVGYSCHWCTKNHAAVEQRIFLSLKWGCLGLLYFNNLAFGQYLMCVISIVVGQKL